MKKSNPKVIAIFTAIAAVVLLMALKPAPAGLMVGDKAADFNLKNVDGKNVSLSGLKNNKGAIVIFTCNNCPFSIAYEDRIIALHKKYESKGFPVIAINPNDEVKVPEDSFDNMVLRAKEKNFPFAYLQDPTQTTARFYGASRTPHVFILVKEGTEYKVQYIGTIDNNTDDADAATQKYVENAMDEILAGKKVTVDFTKAIGCAIKWKS